MPAVTIVSTAGGTLVYTEDRATKEAPTQFVWRSADGETGNVAVLDTEQGDTVYEDGVYLNAGETFAVNLVAGQDVTFIAETGTVDGNWYIRKF